MHTHSLLLAALGLLVAAAPASAKRIALMEFQGPGHGAAQVAVARALRAENTVIPRAQLEARLADVALLPRCTREDLVGIASAVGADAIVCGTLRGQGVLIEIYNGGDGQLLRSLRVRRINRAALARLNAQVGPALAGAWSWAPTEVGKQRGAAPRARLSERSTMASLPESGVWDNGEDSGDRENPLAGHAPRARPEAAVSSRAVVVRGDGEHALRVGLGPAMLLRRNYRVYGASSTRDGQGWTTSPVAGIALSGEVYPAAWFTRGWASHLGVGLGFARYFGPSWRFADSNSEQNASHQVLSVDVRGRFALWRSPRALELTVRAGYRRVDAHMNETDLAAVIPDASISSVETGVGLRLPILPRWLSVSASFDYLPVLGRGEISSETEYGAASGGGYLFTGGLRGDIWGGLGWQLDVEYAWYTHSFDPESNASAARHAEAARDRYLSMVAQITYRN